jgi:hypothetical protein
VPYPKKPRLGYPSTTEATKALFDQGQSHNQIANALGITSGSVSVMLRKMGATPCSIYILPPDVAAILQPIAEARNETITDLCRHILILVVREDLLNAVLDEDEG